jgi:hypothetical protein
MRSVLIVKAVFEAALTSVDLASEPDVHSVDIPFNLKQGSIIVEASVNGSGPYRAMLDTGVMLIVSPALAKELRLRNEGAEPVVGAGEATGQSWWATLSEVQIGGPTGGEPASYTTNGSPWWAH